MEKYYIEEIKDINTDADMAVGYISSQKHGRCVRVFGDNYELTQKLIKIVNALNEK